MRKNKCLFAFMAVLVLGLIGCGMLSSIGYGTFNSFRCDAKEVNAAALDYTSEWPDNEYTKAIIKPDVGEMDYTLSDENGGYYSVFLKNVTMEEGEQYIQLLKENGFESVSDASNSVATGELLQKGNTGLNVSVSENVLGIRITLNAEETKGKA